MPLHGESLAAHVVCTLESRIRVAAADFYAGRIGPSAFVDETDSIICCLPVQYRRQAPRSRPKWLNGVLRDVRAGCDNDGDWFADIPDFVGGERQLKEMLESGHRGNARRIGFRDGPKSEWVKTPTTPGTAAAAVTSMLRIRPCGHALRNSAA